LFVEFKTEQTNLQSGGDGSVGGEDREPGGEEKGVIGRDALTKHHGRIDGVTAGVGNALAESKDEGNGEKNGNMAGK
jgi:hypothetical protein